MKEITSAEWEERVQLVRDMVALHLIAPDALRHLDDPDVIERLTDPEWLKRAAAYCAGKQEIRQRVFDEVMAKRQ